MMRTTFTLHFSGDQENPPTGSEASGSGTVYWDPKAKTAKYEYTVNGVDFGPVLGKEPQTETTADDVTILHVHNAERGVNGPIVFGQIGPAQDEDDLKIELNHDGSWTVSGKWEKTDPANVSIKDFAETLNEVYPGSEAPLYFNVHTTTFPGGEIRAQWVAEHGHEDWCADGERGRDHHGDTGSWWCV
jgi:serralysin